MDSSAALLNRARQSLVVAEQMLIRTYPVVKDPKLILAVAGDLHVGLTNCIEALCRRKNIETDDFDSTFAAFECFAVTQGFSDKDIRLVKTINDIIEAHKQSPVEFPRHDAFVICDDNYGMRCISVNDMKRFLFESLLFFEKVENVFRAK